MQCEPWDANSSLVFMKKTNMSLEVTKKKPYTSDRIFVL